MLKDKTDSLKEGQVNKRVYTQDMICVALGWKNNYCKGSKCQYAYFIQITAKGSI